MSVVFQISVYLSKKKQIDYNNCSIITLIQIYNNLKILSLSQIFFLGLIIVPIRKSKNTSKCMLKGRLKTTEINS